MLRSNRFALAAAALLVVISSCGDSSGRTTTASSLAVIKLGSASNAGGEAQAADRMMPIQFVEYVYDGDFPDLGASAPAWLFQAGAIPNTDDIRRLATVLGVEGDVVSLPADQGGGWLVGPADYSAATINVSADGLLSWWFNPTGVAYVGTGCASPDGGAIDSGTATTDPVPVDVPADTIPVDGSIAPCEEPVPPANVPDEIEARRLADELFAAIGIDTSNYEFEIYADEWGANVTGYLVIDGMRTWISTSVGFGTEGSVTWASGSLAEAQPAGEYPLVGPEVGLERLNDDLGMWGPYYGYPTGITRGGGTADTGVAVGVGAPTEPACDPSTDCVVDTVPPNDTVPSNDTVPVDPEPIIVHLDAVHLDLTTIWDINGAVWLLPAYTFTGPDGVLVTIPAVDDSFIVFPDVLPMPEPLPVESVPVDNVPGDPAVPPEVDPVVAQEALVGLLEADAEKVATELGWTIRVAERDGEVFALTADFSPTRVNLEIVDGVVTAVAFIG